MIRSKNIEHECFGIRLEALAEWGLSRVFGYPGDGVGGLDVALEKAPRIYALCPGAA